ncbi:SDR family oxidoreductase [Cohnella rhizosphaerae]|uniref:SDR family oxidoreductase n=1 Tax=Cohnella rhizosphaerae TaxID=1457232 RepID=A0A9X4KR72_9BACL|nr:SDR family oxidoreductase [Cohnella rhizosphaerae]MDG0809163.1 SDR family oxidoreductase [Cohnella rhizosphaerae]
MATHGKVEKTALVTGASSGFGLLIAVELAKRGYRVAAVMRDTGKQAALMQAAEQAGAGGRIETVKLDVTSAEAIEAAVADMLRRSGRIDVLVNNAGMAVGGFAEEVPMSAWRTQMETNFLGLVAMTRAVLPAMRAQGGGTIVQMSSVSGLWGIPGFGAYAASKFAVEGFSESLRHEVAPFGIRVALVEPGAYRTAIWAKGFADMHAQPDSPYAGALAAVLRMARRTAASAPDPREVAELVGRLADKRRLSRLRYPIGRGARLLPLVVRLLPWRVVEAATRRAMRGQE